MCSSNSLRRLPHTRALNTTHHYAHQNESSYDAFKCLYNTITIHNLHPKIELFTDENLANTAYSTNIA